MNKETIKQSLWYIIIGVCSAIMLIFFPMVGSTVSANWKLPETNVEWVVWIITKLSVSGLNMLIFHSFNMQGKVNIKDNENYKKACEILGGLKNKASIPRSPSKYQGGVYGKKGTTLILSTFLALIAFSQVILTYDYTTLITYSITLVMGIVFGIMQMLKSELYWTTEFYDYAIMMQEEEKNGN